MLVVLYYQHALKLIKQTEGYTQMIKYFNTRTEARAFAAANNTKVIDNTSSAEKGKRWEVQVLDAMDKVHEVLEMVQEEVPDLKPLPVLKAPAVIVRNHKEYKKDRKGNTVTVYSKRKQVL